jgi:hypothetical protein
MWQAPYFDSQFGAFVEESLQYVYENASDFDDIKSHEFQCRISSAESKQTAGLPLINVNLGRF